MILIMIDKGFILFIIIIIKNYYNHYYKQSKLISNDDNGKPTATPQLHIPNPSNTSLKNHQSAKFDPTRCIKVNLTKQFTNTNPFNQDQNRKGINDIHGPIIIEKIVPYKYQTNKLKEFQAQAAFTCSSKVS